MQHLAWNDAGDQTPDPASRKFMGLILPPAIVSGLPLMQYSIPAKISGYNCPAHPDTTGRTPALTAQPCSCCRNQLLEPLRGPYGSLCATHPAPPVIPSATRSSLRCPVIESTESFDLHAGLQKNITTRHQTPAVKYNVCQRRSEIPAPFPLRLYMAKAQQELAENRWRLCLSWYNSYELSGKKTLLRPLLSLPEIKL